MTLGMQFNLLKLLVRLYYHAITRDKRKVFSDPGILYHEYSKNWIDYTNYCNLSTKGTSVFFLQFRNAGLET